MATQSLAVECEVPVSLCFAAVHGEGRRCCPAACTAGSDLSVKEAKLLSII